MNAESNVGRESPQVLRTSLAAAMTLGFKKGLFYRNARLHCINLLLTYADGCRARCAYCGLSGTRPGLYSRKSFIRVQWPTYSLDEILEGISSRQEKVKRICLSMITHSRAAADTRDICRRLRSRLQIPVSLLISPTRVGPKDLEDFRSAGADKIGVAIDLATPELFDRHRGSGVGGPHRWDMYWRCLSQAVAVFGPGNAGAHFMAGMGECEKEMCAAMQRVRGMEGRTHLFSFFPEAESLLEHGSPPPLDQYRRIQVARYLIDNRMAVAASFTYSETGEIQSFGISREELDRIVDSGEPFRTSGCTGYDGEVACNRPFANSRPGPEIRNYPFPPTPEDLEMIRLQLGLGRSSQVNWKHPEEASEKQPGF